MGRAQGECKFAQISNFADTTEMMRKFSVSSLLSLLPVFYQLDLMLARIAV